AAGRCRTLAISDVHVPPDDPATIGSGPTAADDTTYAQALSVLEEFAIAVPRAVRTYLERGASGEIEETPKPGDPRLKASGYHVLANRHTAMEAAAREAKRRGYVVRVIDRATRGEAREAGRALLALALAAEPVAGRPCTI